MWSRNLEELLEFIGIHGIRRNSEGFDEFALFKEIQIIRGIQRITRNSDRSRNLEEYNDFKWV